MPKLTYLKDSQLKGRVSMNDIKKFISKWLELAVMTFSFVMFCILLLWFSFYLFFGEMWADNNNEKDFFTRYHGTTSASSVFDSQYLTHRLLKMDLFYGITTSETMTSALNNVNNYLLRAYLNR